MTSYKPEPVTAAFQLEAMTGQTTVGVQTESVTFKERPGLRVVDAAAPDAGDYGRLVIIPDSDLLDGTIELDVAGDVGDSAGAPPQARGFVGVAFRVQPGGKPFNCFYLRPTNGRADDQVRRNHSAQYIASPEFPWHRLREEFPEKYESYVDIVPSEWIHIKVEFKGTCGRLYVNRAEQPTLIINDLKVESKGAVALWLGPATVAHFSDLRLTPASV